MNSLQLLSVAPAKRILVVDDAVDNLFLLQTVLEVEGYQVEIADSGKAALAKIELQPPDLLLLDVMMPGMNGIEVVQHIRQNRNLPFIPVVLVTGCDRSSESQELDIEDFIAKPVDFDKLLWRVGTILAMPNLEAKAIANRRLAS
ncbi:MAG TPA: response regulator [Leptolyngbyaceae cyanobacterium]